MKATNTCQTLICIWISCYLVKYADYDPVGLEWVKFCVSSRLPGDAAADANLLDHTWSDKDVVKDS